MDLKKKKYKFWLDLYYTNILLRIFFLRVESYSILNSRIFLAITVFKFEIEINKDKPGLLFKAKFFGIQSIFRFIFRKVL